MDAIRSWALGLTAAAIIGAVTLMLTPKGSVEKSVEVAVSLFILCALLGPFVSGIDLGELTDGLAEIPSEVDTSAAYGALEAQTGEAIEEEVTKILTDCGIKNADVNIDVRMDGENNLSVADVNISVDSEYKALTAAAESEIFEKLGIKCKIGVRE